MSKHADPNRTIQLAFIGPGLADGNVPLTVVADKLHALQNLLFHAAATISGDSRQRRGTWFNKFREVAELSFQDAHHSDLCVVARIPKAATFLGAPARDMGAEAVDLVFKFAESSKVKSDTSGLVGDGRDRVFLLRALENLCPGPMEEYTVKLSNGNRQHAPLSFSAETRREFSRQVSAELRPVLAPRQETIVGDLTKIHVDTAPQLIAVRVGSGTEIDCYFDDSLRDQISNLVAGSVVEVTGVATLDRDGRVQRLDTILDVETVSMDPLRLFRFSHGGNKYKLREPLVVDVAFQDGVWSYNSEAINLWGYGARREDAVKDLHENFDYLWREIAQETDAKLDARALELKRKLVQLVEQHPKEGR